MQNATANSYCWIFESILTTNRWLLPILSHNPLVFDDNRIITNYSPEYKFVEMNFAIQSQIPTWLYGYICHGLHFLMFCSNKLARTNLVLQKLALMNAKLLKIGWVCWSHFTMLKFCSTVSSIFCLCSAGFQDLS